MTMQILLEVVCPYLQVYDPRTGQSAFSKPNQNLCIDDPNLLGLAGSVV